MAEGVELPRLCPHHWLIEAPKGRTSRGRCRRCGAERTFPNSLPTDWRGLPAPSEMPEFWRREHV